MSHLPLGGSSRVVVLENAGEIVDRSHAAAVVCRRMWGEVERRGVRAAIAPSRGGEQVAAPVNHHHLDPQYRERQRETHRETETETDGPRETGRHRELSGVVGTRQ